MDEQEKINEARSRTIQQMKDAGRVNVPDEEPLDEEDENDTGLANFWGTYDW